jgi:YgiT-type zinc finger domain-containing protein
MMNCVICKFGETQPGTTTLTLERDEMTLVVKAVPAQVCQNCGEVYLDEEVSAQVVGEAEAAAKSGVQVDVRTYMAA